MKICIGCGDEVTGRTDKKFCSSYCKSSYHYKENLKNESDLYKKVDKQLRLNRRLLKNYNKAGKAIVRKEELIKVGFNPQYFTNYWKTQKNEVYLFCYEFGFLEKKEHGISKYILVKWQNYMAS